jgi:hypothetical protein
MRIIRSIASCLVAGVAAVATARTTPAKLNRSVLRHIRVASKQELKDRLMAAVGHFNQHPVVHTWTYKLDRAA